MNEYISIESTIGPGGIVAVAWIKSSAAIYMLKMSIWSATCFKIILAAIVITVESVIQK